MEEAPEFITVPAEPHFHKSVHPHPPVHMHCTNTLAQTLPNKEVNFETMDSHIAIYLTLFANLELDSNILARKCVDEMRNLARKHIIFFPLCFAEDPAATSVALTVRCVQMISR